MTAKYSPPPRFPARLFSPTLSRWAISAALLLSAGAASATPPTALYVATTGSDSNAGTSQASPFLTIQAAITASNNGDTIDIADGTYTGPGDVDLDTNGKNLTIQSEHGAASTIIDCGGSNGNDHRGFYIHYGETVTLHGLTIKNGYESAMIAGGAVEVSFNVSATTVIIEACKFQDNFGLAAVANVHVNYSANVQISDSQFSGGNGGVASYGDLTVTNCQFNNIVHVGIQAFGVNSGGTATITNCLITNTGLQGLYNSCPSFTATNCTLAGNATGVIADSYPLTLTNVIVRGPYAVYPINGGSAATVNCDIEGRLSARVTGTNTIDADPLFVSATDFHLQATSPALGAGTATGAPSTDIDGTTRPSPPSIGAYEAGSAPVTLTSIAITPATPSVTVGSTQQFTATATYSNSTTAIVTNSASWASDSANATIDSTGLATGVAAGTANITATYNGVASTPVALTVTRAPRSIWYVSPAGNDSNDGSQSSPLLTIQAAIDYAASGNTIDIADGTYTGPGDVDLDTLGKNLTIQSDHGAAHTIINCGGSSTINHRGFYIHSGETVSITGLTIENGYENGEGGGIYNDGAVLNITACTFSGNSASPYGGGIFSSGPATLTNCTLSGNSASTYGGGILSSGPATLTNCTLSGNTAQNGGGFMNYDTATLTNCIVYGDTNGEIVTNGFGTTFTVTFCDVQGGVPLGVIDGGSNIDADPLFVSASNFHLQPTSPALGAGTATGAPLTDLSGTTRPAPPSIGAYEIGVASVVVLAPGTTHVLWDNPDKRVSIWNYDTAAGTFTQNTYGPYTGWTAAGIADGGTDGLTRVLWDSDDSRTSLWSLDNTTGAFTQNTFGPYPGWTAASVSVAANNTTHVLWNNADKRVSIWNYDTAAGTFTQNTYGPYEGWTAAGIADGGTDGLTRVLWDSSDGRMSLWSLDNTTGAFTQHTFGPYPGWTAASVSVAPDNTTHILWNNADKRVSVWNYDTNAGTFTQNTFGSYYGWTAAGIADGPDGTARVLWDHENGAMSLWSLDNLAGTFTQNTFGPYSPFGPGENWTAVGVSVGH